MPSSLPIPAGPTDLNSSWLTAALVAGRAIEQAVVSDFTVEPPTGETGLYAQTVRVRLKYDKKQEKVETGAPLSLIAKFSASSPQMRERAFASYEKEIHFYRQLAQHSALPTPVCYFADSDPSTQLHVILLQDMAPASSGSRVAGCTQAQARLAVHHIAAFHAAWWDHPALDGMTWLPDPDFGQNPTTGQAEYEGWWPLFLGNTGDVPLPPAIRALGERFGSHRAQVEQHLFNVPPRTLLHGDYHVGNMVFATKDGGIPFAVIDWQMVRRGRGVRDVAYFLSENLMIEDRRAVETDLLVEYHRLLVAGGVRCYAFAQCLIDYKLALLQRFRALVSTIAVMPFTPAEHQMHVDVLLPRNIAAILENCADAVITDFNAKT